MQTLKGGAVGFLDRKLSDLSEADLVRMIQREVSNQVPAIPTGVLSLSDQAVPVTIPAGTSAAGQAIVWDADVAAWVASDSVNSALTVPDGSIGDSKLVAMSASKLTAGVIDASVIALQTASSGVRLAIDINGLTGFDTNGLVTVQIPTDGITATTFNGQVNATAIGVATSLTVNGSSGVLVQPNSRIRMIGGQSDPTTAPVVTHSYPNVLTLSFAVDANTYIGSRISHYSATGGSGGATACIYGTITTLAGGGTQRVYAVEWLASNGSINRSLQLDNGVAPSILPTGSGACLIGSKVIAVRKASGTGILVFDVIARSTFTLSSTVTISPQPGSSHFDPTSNGTYALGCDGTNPFFFSYSSATNIGNRGICTMSAGSPTGAVTFTDWNSGSVKFNSPGNGNNLGDTGYPISLTGAAWDGTNWYVCYTWGNSGGVNVGRVLQMYVQSSSAIVSKQEIYLPTTVGFFGGGLVNDGTDFYGQGGSGQTTYRRIKGSTAVTWDYTAGNVWNFAYTWEDVANPYHTGGSPQAPISFDSGITAAPLMRETIVFTLPALPSLATQNWIYALQGSSPATTTLKKQAATTFVSTNTGQSITWKSYDGTGGNPGASTFPAGGTPAKIDGDNSGRTGSSWYMDSAGIFRVPRFTTAGRSTTAGDIGLNTDTGQLEMYDGTAVQRLGQSELDRMIYDALYEADSTAVADKFPFAFTLDPSNCPVAADVTLTTQRQVGACFMVTKPRTATGLWTRVNTAATSITGGSYAGGGLYQFNTATGGWTFLKDTGANDSTLIGGGGSPGSGNRTQALSATQALVPGTLYVATIMGSWTGTSPILAGLNTASPLNLGQAVYMRCSSQDAVTTRQNANVAIGSLTARTNIPLIGIY
jgi:hypothetical protein